MKSRSDQPSVPGSFYAHGEEIPSEYLYDNSRSTSTFSLKPYRGFRVLCTGDPIENDSKWFGYDKDKDDAPDAAGTATASTVVDVNKKLIANSILEYDGTQWKVFARPYEDQFNDNDNPMRYAPCLPPCLNRPRTSLIEEGETALCL